MKAVVLTLALLFLTGSQAQHVTQQDDPKSQWEQVEALAKMYLDSAKNSSRKYIAQFEATDLAKKLKLKPLRNLDTLSHKVTDLGNKLGLPTHNFWAKVAEQTQNLSKNLEEVMTPHLEGIRETWRERVLPPAKKQLERLQKKLGQLGEKVQNRTRPYLDSLRPHLEPLKAVLESIAEEVHKCLQPPSDKLCECLRTIREDLDPGLLEGIPGLAELPDVGGQLRTLREQVGLPAKELYEKLWTTLQDNIQIIYQGLPGQ